MSGILEPCCSPCNTTLPPVNIPGTRGPEGANGINGTNGQSVNTNTTAQFTSSADLTTPMIVSVASSLQMVVGQTLIVGQGPGATLTHPGPVTILVTAVASPNTFTGHLVNATDENVIVSSGASVTPTGSNASVAFPITLAQGGTNATGGTAALIKASAQSNLGLGQDAIISSNSGLTQAITTTVTQVGTIDITIPALGSYLYFAHVSVDWNGVTFGVTQVLTVTIKNVTNPSVLATAVRNTQALTTLKLPSSDYHIPFILDATAAIGDHIQIQIVSSPTNPPNSAGTFTVIAGSLVAVPLRKS